MTTLSSGSNKCKRKTRDEDESSGGPPPKSTLSSGSKRFKKTGGKDSSSGGNLPTNATFTRVPIPITVEMSRKCLDDKGNKFIGATDGSLRIVLGEKQPMPRFLAEVAHEYFKSEMVRSEEDLKEAKQKMIDLMTKLVYETEGGEINESDQRHLNRQILIAREIIKKIKEIKNGTRTVLLPEKATLLISMQVNKGDYRKVSYPKLVKCIENTPKHSGGMVINTHRIDNDRIERTYTRIKRCDTIFCLCGKMTTGKITFQFKILEEVKDFCFSNYCPNNKRYVDVRQSALLNQLNGINPFMGGTDLSGENKTPLKKNDILAFTVNAKTREITFSLNGGTEFSHWEKIPLNNTIRLYFNMDVGGKVRISYIIHQ